jgi:hypothetical protein
MSIFFKPALPIRWISMLFGIQQTTMVYKATLEFISMVRPIIYEEVYAMSQHQLFITLKLGFSY